MPAEAQVDPFADLIGGQEGAPAFQQGASGSWSEVPKAQLNALPAPEVGVFSDLVPRGNASGSAPDLGPFYDLIPQKENEIERALAETPTPHWKEASIRAFKPADAPLDLVNTVGTWVDNLFRPGQDSGARLLSPEVAKAGVEMLSYANPLSIAAKLTGGKSAEIDKAVQGSIAEGVSSASSLEGIASLPSFAISGVAEAYAIGVLAKLPEQYGRVKEAIQQHGLVSGETAKAAADAGIQDLMGFLAVKGSHLLRGKGEAEAPVRPASEPGSAPATESGPATETPQGAEPAPVATAAEAAPQTADVVPPVGEQSETATVPQVPVRPEESQAANAATVLEAYKDTTTPTSVDKQVTQPESTAPHPESATPIEEGNDWTQATAESNFKLGGNSEGGFINLQGVADAIDTAKEKTGMKIGGKANDLNVATAERSAKLQQSFADAERAQKEIGKIAKTERRQGAISLYIEANGDQAVLDQWAKAAKGSAFRQAAEDARALKPEEIAIAQKAKQAFSALEARGNTYDVLNSHRDNYVPHVWDVSKKFTGIGSSKLQDKFKFNKARTFANFFEGDQAGFTPKTLAIGKLLPAYLHEMNTVIADRQFVRDVSKGLSSDQRPLAVPRGKISEVPKEEGKAFLVNPHTQRGTADTSDYKLIDQSALHEWIMETKDTSGNHIYTRNDLAAHPELAKRLNAMMGQSEIRRWYNEPSTGLSVVPRAIAKGLDTAQSVMKREMFGLLAPFHQVQEGTHAVGHMVNPTFGLEDMSKPTAAHIDAMQNGLMLLPEKGSGSRYIEGVGGKNSFLSQVTRKFGGPAGRMVANTIDGYQDYLFHQYIPSLKFKTYEHIVERNMKRYAKDITSGEVTAGDVKMLSAEQTNAAYGHLNYALLDRNPTMQHILQLGLLAPDFLEARARFVGQALKPSKAGFEQFRAIAVLAAVQAGTAYTLSQLIPGASWDAKHPFELTVGNRTYTLRSVPEDLFRLIASGSDARREFISARTNPLGTKLYQGIISGRNYRGEKVGFWDTMGELLANYIPITARQIPGIRQLTKTSRDSPTSPLEQLAGSLGLKISRYSPITKTYQLASEWKKSAGIPADTGSYPVSKYIQLRYALEDGDMAKAKAEYQKLREAGMMPSKITSGFKESIDHPFTGNKANDLKFKQSLNADGKNAYEMALQRRRDILRRYGFLH